ncbi:MAG TPA: LLM class flavin-dependent oxidoreductase [Candidatus Dormibacteraeota bacterium]|jgi:alkanesulfonate monooxygenase SsuD/methylene tetrahydromethanopterin reductase-like flavin-dependent oxidoreductase (luciferase family)
MAKVGIMIEGQEGLNWDRWRRICHDTDTLGFDSLRRSDHLVSLMGAPERDCIECWISLALAAEWTNRIEFGPMVSPMTFRHPAVLARMAASVDVLSGGRVILGVGAGWNENEHREFGIPFLTERQRFDLLEQGVRTMRETWSKSNPKPIRNPMPLLMGGKGRKRTLPIVAREASEWNQSRLDTEMYKESREVLDACCRDIGRDPRSIRHSVMAGYIIGRDRSELRERASQVSQVVRDLKGMTPDEVLEDRRSAWFVGTPEEIAEKMRQVSGLGVDLFMLQHFLLDDSDALSLLAAEVLPAVA